MKLVMTMMVRNEADIIKPVIDHHLAQGVDLIIVTDNGSTDGTTTILEEYQALGVLELRHDPEHRKQQSEVVTAMARDAYTVHGADWVINADADEFYVPKDRTLSLRDVFERMPTEIRSFTASTVNLVGEPALRGTGLQRLVYRDLRPVEVLEEKGLLSHPIPNAVHVGDAEVVVGQGNHLVSIPSDGAPPEGLEIENLHLPWRSWAQMQQKVEMAGLAYEASPERIPGPDHHGMRDRARQANDTLFSYYLVRHPLPEELDEGLERGWFEEERLLADTLASPEPDEPISEQAVAEWRRVRPLIAQAESNAIKSRRLDEAMIALRDDLDQTRAALQDAERRATDSDEELARERASHSDDHRRDQSQIADLQSRLGRILRRPEVRAGDAARRRLGGG